MYKVEIHTGSSLKQVQILFVYKEIAMHDTLVMARRMMLLDSYSLVWYYRNIPFAFCLIGSRSRDIQKSQSQNVRDVLPDYMIIGVLFELMLGVHDTHL